MLTSQPASTRRLSPGAGRSPRRVRITGRFADRAHCLDQADRLRALRLQRAQLALKILTLRNEQRHLASWTAPPLP